MSTLRKDYEHNVQDRVEGSEKPKVLQGLTPRVVIMLVILTVFATWLNIGDPKIGLGFLVRLDEYDNELSLPSPVGLLVTLILTFVAFKLKPLAKALRLDFTKAELLTLYICVGLVFMLSSGQFAMNVISVMGTLPFRLSWFPTSHTHTATLSRWLFPFDETGMAAESFMFGEGPVVWSAWIRPLIMWFIFYGAMFFLMYAAASLLYSRWSDIERLPFPLVTPIVKLAESMEGTAGKEYTLKNTVFLIGILLPIVLKIPTILHDFAPAVPRVLLSWKLHEVFTNGIMGQSFAVWPGTNFWVLPYVVGIGYLVPTDFTFSIWFSFYVIQRLILFPVLISAGIPTNGDMYPEIMFRGGVLVYGVFLLWMVRKSLVKYVMAAIGKEESDVQEHPISPKLLVFGSIVAIVVVMWFGMALLSIQFHVMLFYLLSFMSIAIVHARFRTEPGLPFVQMWSNSAGTLLTLVGSETPLLTRVSRVGMGYIDKFTVWSVPSTTAWVMEGLKIADETGMRRRSMMKAMGLMILLLFVISFPLIIYAFQSVGLGFSVGYYTATEAPGQTHALPGYKDPAPYGVLFWVLGAGITIFCAFMRLNYVWWPFHPWGFLLGQQLDTYYRFPGSFFVAWLVKAVIFRWFGKRIYDKLKPFFIGVILSDVTMMIVHTLLSYFKP